MPIPKMVKKDFVTSIVLTAFSISIIVSSYTMPRLERRNIDPFSAPGVVPGMIGLILLCLSLILLIRSIKRGGYRLFARDDDTDGEKHQGAALRVIMTLVISLIYAIGFLGRLDYSIGTAIYIFSFISLFEYQTDIPPLKQKNMFIMAILQAVIASLLITVVFRKLFLVDLP